MYDGILFWVDFIIDATHPNMKLTCPNWYSYSCGRQAAWEMWKKKIPTNPKTIGLYR